MILTRWKSGGNQNARPQVVAVRHFNTLEKRGESKLLQKVLALEIDFNTLEKRGESKLYDHSDANTSDFNTLEKRGESKL